MLKLNGEICPSGDELVRGWRDLRQVFLNIRDGVSLWGRHSFSYLLYQLWGAARLVVLKTLGDSAQSRKEKAGPNSKCYRSPLYVVRKVLIC